VQISERPTTERGETLPYRLATRTPRNRLFRVAVAAALILAALVALGFSYAGRQALLAPANPAGAAPAAPADTASPAGNWDKIAACESGGDWNTNTGNGYYGGLQLNLTTWRDYGGQGLPHQASKATQIAIAEKVLAQQGWGAWSVCSRKAGLHSTASKA
jgi:hypothetical protein